MACLDCHFYSESLGMNCTMNVILPQNQTGTAGKISGDAPRVLYLLHGYSDDHSTWLRNTNIERYATALGIAVIMPGVHKSYYADMYAGGKYWTFVSEELPTICHSLFRLSGHREDTFVAGLSMGGYGAFKLAMTFPDRFAAAASLSGALMPDRLWTRNPMVENEKFVPIFGSPELFKHSVNDLIYLAESLKQRSTQLPQLFQCCGTEDFLYDDNRTFLEILNKLEIPVCYEEEPGDHEWGYWDRKIERVLAWLPPQLVQ